MSTSRGGGRNSVNGGKGNSSNSNIGNSSNGVVGSASIPAGSKKIVQSLKEIVNYPEVEIYAMLKECNMNPDEAVERLLSQDQFHEVKSKREKKKETKDTPDLKFRGASIRGGKGGVDRFTGHGSTNQSASLESAALRGNPTQKKENGATVYAVSSSSGLLGKNVTQRVLSPSDPPTGYKAYIGDKQEGILPLHPPSGLQPVWSGVPGQKSMADIVKMGRPYGKSSSNVNALQQSDNNYLTVTPSSGPHDLLSHEHYPAMIPETNSILEEVVDHYVLPNDDWPLDEHPPTTSLPPLPEQSVGSEAFIDSSNLQYDIFNQQLHHRVDEVQDVEEDEQNSRDISREVSGTDKVVQEDNSGHTSAFDNVSHKNVNSYQVDRHAFDHEEVEVVGISVSSVAANLQKLNIAKGGEDSASEIGSPAVKIPQHLQVQSAECSHLSFGSFGSGMSGPFSGPFAESKPLKSGFEVAPVEVEAPSVDNPDTGNPDYYGDEHLLAASDRTTAQLTPSPGNYDSSSTSQPDVLKQEAPEVVRDQYTFPSSASNYAFEDNRHLNQSLAPSQTSPQMQNLPPLSSVVEHSDSLPSNLLGSNVQPVREPALPYSAFSTTQSLPTRYSSSMASMSGPTISLTEVLKTGNLSSAQPTHTGSSVSGAAALQQQHLSVHPYSQPSLPLGHFANVFSMPFMPQSYTYVPSAFQQSFADNSSYHQALAAILPQYKNSVSVNSLPPSGAVASGYGGGFGSSTPGNFPLSQPTAPVGASMDYDDILNSQYKDGNHLLSLQQNENSPLWIQNPGSRTMAAVPASSYYSFQGQSQQAAGFRQNQAPSQHYGNLGYQNLYHSQSGLSMEHQQQLLRDAATGGSQGQSKQSQQMWQNNY